MIIDYSVLMSVYYKENPEFLDMSIKSMIDQTVLTNNFVLVCDGPLTSELDTVIEKYCNLYPGIMNIVRLEKNGGLGNALNIGMKHCKNEIIARMDSDDVAIPERCKMQLDIIYNKAIDIVSGNILEFSNVVGDSDTVRAVPESQEEILKFVKRRNPFNHPAVMYKRKAVMKAGEYQSFYLLEDYYLWIRMLQSGAIAYNIQEPILYMRTGSGIYTRRGGFSYFKTIFNLRMYMKKTGLSSWVDVMHALVGYSFLSMVPSGLREKVYGLALRIKGK